MINALRSIAYAERNTTDFEYKKIRHSFSTQIITFATSDTKQKLLIHTLEINSV